MATHAITHDTDTINLEIQIAASPARVFQAITDPQQVPQWWGQQGMYRITKWEGDLRLKGKWRSEGQGADGKNFHVEGEYLEINPPHLLVYSWLPSFSNVQKTTVRWELTPHEGGTLVKIIHSGFQGNVRAAKDHSQGWTRVLGWVQAFVESGQTVENR